jgi:excisionase family DNA binding protein
VTTADLSLRQHQGPGTTPPLAKLLVSPEEAAHVLSIGRTRVYRLIATGELRSMLVGRSRRIPASALAEFVRRLEIGADSAVVTGAGDDGTD